MSQLKNGLSKKKKRFSFPSSSSEIYQKKRDMISSIKCDILLVLKMHNHIALAWNEINLYINHEFYSKALWFVHKSFVQL